MIIRKLLSNLSRNMAMNNPADEDGKTPLHTAAIYGDMLSVLLIQQISQDKNPENEARWTPLHDAALHCHLEITRLLLQHSQDKKSNKARLA
jgi:ankyrin repeat protein